MNRRSFIRALLAVPLAAVGVSNVKPSIQWDVIENSKTLSAYESRKQYLANMKAITDMEMHKIGRQLSRMYYQDDTFYNAITRTTPSVHTRSMTIPLKLKGE